MILYFELREDSQIVFVTRNVLWTFEGKRFCTGRFFCHEKHPFLNTQDFKEFLYFLTADLVKVSIG